MALRPYQQAAFEAAIDWMKRCVEPCLLELATGSGKSHICSAIAEWVNNTSGKRVLCLAPSSELVVQNHEKYLATGSPASIFSASAGQKSLTHDVVFGTPKTVLNNLHKFGDFAAVIVDECFSPDTLITTSIGKVEISKIDAKKHKIACYNEKTGAVQFDHPVRVWSNGTRNVSLVKHTDGEVRCTPTHRIFSEGQWVQARYLNPGQRIRLKDSRSSALIRLRRASAAVAIRLIQAAIKVQSEG